MKKWYTFIIEGMPLGHRGFIMLSDSMPVMYLKCFVDHFSVFAEEVKITIKM